MLKYPETVREKNAPSRNTSSAPKTDQPVGIKSMGENPYATYKPVLFWDIDENIW